MKDTFILCKDWISYVSSLEEKDKAELLTAIFNYNNGMEVGKLSYGVKICFAHIKQFREKQDEKYLEIVEKRSEAGKKGGRPPKEKTKKANAFGKSKGKQTEANKSNTNLTDTDISISNDIDDISNDISYNNSNNTLCIIKYNTGTGQIEESIIEYNGYGNKEINQVMEMVSLNNDGAMDGTKAKNRQFANNLIKKIKDLPTVKEGKIQRNAVLAIILGVMKDDKFHGSKLSSPENIYHNFGTLMTETRKKFSEKKANGFKSF